MYLDPGIGSMIIQVLVAGIAVAGAILVILREKIKNFFKKKKKAEVGSDKKVVD